MPVAFTGSGWRSPSAAVADPSAYDIGGKGNQREIPRRPDGRPARDPSRSPSRTPDRAEVPMRSPRPAARVRCGPGLLNIPRPAHVLPAHVPPPMTSRTRVPVPSVAPVWAHPVREHNHVKVRKLSPAVVSTKRRFGSPTCETRRDQELDIRAFPSPHFTKSPSSTGSAIHRRSGHVIRLRFVVGPGYRLAIRIHRSVRPRVELQSFQAAYRYLRP